MTGAGLYIHIPFCRSKCGYCAFNSKAWPGDDGPSWYLEAVRLELERLAGSWDGLTFATFFVGGGTPSIYSGEALAGLIAEAISRLRWCEGAEISVEANPNSVTLAGLAALRCAGVNRLSLGVQSLVDCELIAAGRQHSAAEAMSAVAMARQAGFDNLNLDLIYGLPGQSLASWRQGLAAAIELSPEHLSLYELSIEPGTPFAARAARGDLSLPDDDALAEMEAMAQEELARHGYQRYEVSNFARLGFACRHNLNYWHNGNYLGLGAGAVSCLDGLRLKNEADPERYRARITANLTACHDGEALGDAASFRESVIMGLRLVDGVDLALLRARYGLDPLSYYGDTLRRLIERGLVAMDQERMRLTAQAMPLAHQVLADLV